MAVPATRSPVSALSDPDLMRSVLDAAGTLLHGRPASAWTAQGNRAILANALDYAVERKLLGHNPVKTVKWKPPKAAQEVDRRCVVNPEQARRLLAAVRKQSPSGPRLAAFFAVIYYAGLRPHRQTAHRKRARRARGKRPRAQPRPILTRTWLACIWAACWTNGAGH